MKVSISSMGSGAAPVPPDYDMLKAALMAAQAATPTARACTRKTVEPRIDPYAALHALFAAGGGGTTADSLGYQFNPSAPREDGAP